MRALQAPQAQAQEAGQVSAAGADKGEAPSPIASNAPSSPHSIPPASLPASLRPPRSLAALSGLTAVEAVMGAAPQCRLPLRTPVLRALGCLVQRGTGSGGGGGGERVGLDALVCLCAVLGNPRLSHKLNAWMLSQYKDAQDGQQGSQQAKKVSRAKGPTAKTNLLHKNMATLAKVVMFSLSALPPFQGRPPLA